MTSTHCLLIFKSPMIRVDGISALPFADRAQQHTIHMAEPREVKSTRYISQLLLCPIFSIIRNFKGKQVISLQRGDLWCIYLKVSAHPWPFVDDTSLLRRRDWGPSRSFLHNTHAAAREELI